MNIKRSLFIIAGLSLIIANFNSGYTDAMVTDKTEPIFVRTSYKEGQLVDLYRLTVVSNSRGLYFVIMQKEEQINRGVYRVATGISKELFRELRGGIPARRTEEFQLKIHGISYILIELTDKPGTYGWVKARESDLLRVT